MRPSEPSAAAAPMTPPRPQLPGPAAIAGRSVTPATLADLWADLVWPKLLESVRLALRPSRIGLGVVFVLGVALIVQLAGTLDGDRTRNKIGEYLGQRVPDQLDSIRRNAETLNNEGAAQSVYFMVVERPKQQLLDRPWAIILAFPLLTLWTGIFGTAISRMAACDHAMGLRITWPQGLGFAMGRWSSSWLALLIPLLLVWLVCLLMAGVGWAAFSIPGVNVVAGGALYVLFLLGGLVAAVVMVAYLIGQPMLLPAVAVESADAVDAVQHTYAFVFARPLRLLVYATILFVQGAISIFLVSAVLELASIAAERSAGAFLSEDLRTQVLQPGFYSGAQKAQGTDAAARWGVRFWSALPTLIGAGFAVSLYFCSATMLYLAMRRVCDGQDTAEIWSPGMVPGTMAPTRKPD